MSTFITHSICMSSETYVHTHLYTVSSVVRMYVHMCIHTHSSYVHQVALCTYIHTHSYYIRTCMHVCTYYRKCSCVLRYKCISYVHTYVRTFVVVYPRTYISLTDLPCSFSGGSTRRYEWIEEVLSLSCSHVTSSQQWR